MVLKDSSSEKISIKLIMRQINQLSNSVINSHFTLLFETARTAQDIMNIYDEIADKVLNKQLNAF